jgi:transcription elongation GreA/GreB family factor
MQGTDFNVRLKSEYRHQGSHRAQLKYVEIYTILGAWDSDPDKNIISYLTPVAQTLLNRKVGEEVAFETHGVQKRFRIDSIGPAKPEAEPVATAASAAAN